MDVVRKLILEKLAEKGLNMSAASIRIGRSHSYLQQFLKRGVPAELLEPERIKLASLLGVDEALLRGPSAALPKRDYTRNSTERNAALDSRAQSSVESDQAEKAAAGATLFGDNDLPVFGTAQGGRGALIVTDHAVDWVVRPAPLLRVRDGYGMIVTGDSMSPKLEAGDTALVNPHLPPRPGDTCIFRNHADDGTIHGVPIRIHQPVSYTMDT